MRQDGTRVNPFAPKIGDTMESYKTRTLVTKRAKIVWDSRQDVLINRATVMHNCYFNEDAFAKSIDGGMVLPPDLDIGIEVDGSFVQLMARDQEKFGGLYRYILDNGYNLNPHQLKMEDLFIYKEYANHKCMQAIAAINEDLDSNSVGALAYYLSFYIDVREWELVMYHDQSGWKLDEKFASHFIFLNKLCALLSDLQVMASYYDSSAFDRKTIFRSISDTVERIQAELLKSAHNKPRFG